MISATSLIAVLMQVITIIFANPNIPQDTKDLVFQQITTAINAQNTQTVQTTQNTQTTQTSPTTTSTPPTPQPVLGQSTPEVSQACKDETVNLKEKEYSVSSQIKERDRQIQNVDIFETGSSPDARERRKQEIRDTFSPSIAKAQETAVKYQDKVKAVCN